MESTVLPLGVLNIKNLTTVDPPGSMPILPLTSINSPLAAKSNGT
ncbi:2057_t:CDS:2 [Entrophospora sp. SA101]|nr:2057_t:CDS:2 [Entrophospora sp. SA101]